MGTGSEVQCILIILHKIIKAKRGFEQWIIYLSTKFRFQLPYQRAYYRHYIYTMVEVLFNDANNKSAKIKSNKAGKSDTPQSIDFEDCLKKVSSYVW